MVNKKLSDFAPSVLYRLKHIIKMSSVYLGLVARKTVFGVSDKARFKPVSSVTGTS